MKGLFFFFVMFICNALAAQRSVQTIVPLQPITAGTVFQVQYIVTGGDVVELQSPAFGKDFRFVSGPRLYQGEALINNIKTPIQNFSYTLIPLRKGRLVVKGATVVYKSGKQKSEDTFVIVTGKSKGNPLSATPITGLPRLAGGDNREEKLQTQIFVKAAVSKQSCFAGEPVEATFTLFSRLPSASEIIKNPGFYGFSVLDMPDAAEGGQTVQTHNGTFYNTHILRHVQLYPMQAGNLLLDKMSVINAIEYADSASGAPLQTTVLTESGPLTIAVKPLPPTTAQNFSGAVGTFSINAHLDKEEWRQNSNGKLTVTIKGAGNFLQLSAPEIAWPKGIDVFEPGVTERLQKEVVPVAGARTYAYTFTTDSAGKFFIPPIAFTYFNPAEKKYKTVHTDSLYFTVLKGKSRTVLPAGIREKTADSHLYGWLIAVAFMVGAGIFLLKKKNTPKKAVPEPKAENRTPDFEKVIGEISAADKDAYRQLQHGCMGFLKSLDIQTDVSKRSIVQQAAADLPADQKKDLQAILEECEGVQYYNAAPTVSFSELQQQAIRFIKTVKEK